MRLWFRAACIFIVQLNAGECYAAYCFGYIVVAPITFIRPMDRNDTGKCADVVAVAGFSVLELLPVVAPGLPVSWSPHQVERKTNSSVFNVAMHPNAPPVAYLTSVETSPCQPSTVHNALQFSMRKLNKRPAIPPVNDLPFLRLLFYFLVRPSRCHLRKCL